MGFQSQEAVEMELRNQYEEADNLRARISELEFELDQMREAKDRAFIARDKCNDKLDNIVNLIND